MQDNLTKNIQRTEQIHTKQQPQTDTGNTNKNYIQQKPETTTQGRDRTDIQLWETIMRVENNDIAGITTSTQEEDFPLSPCFPLYLNPTQKGNIFSSESQIQLTWLP